MPPRAKGPTVFSESDAQKTLSKLQLYLHPINNATTLHKSNAMDSQRKIVSLLFLDIKGYSKLSEPQLLRFFERILPEIAELVRSSKPIYVNTWGDAVVAAHEAPLPSATLALNIRDFLRNTDWKQIEIPRLAARVSLHVGPIFLGNDPFSGASGIVGTQVNLAARVEPITVPDQVWATNNFISLLELEDQELCVWDDLGERRLAKDWGAKRLFRVRRPTEPAELPSLAEPDSDVTGKDELGDKITLCGRLLSVGNEEQKVAALDMLGKISSPDSLSTLVAFAKKKNESQSIREMAFASIMEIGTQSAAMDLIDILADPDEPEVIHGMVVQTLGQLKDPRSFEALRRIAESDEANSRLRGAALQSLARLRDARANTVLSKALEDESPAIIEAAIGAAGFAKRKEFSDRLMQIATSGERFDPSIRSAALEAIILSGTGPMPSVFKGAKELALDINESIKVRERAIMLVAMFESTEGKKCLAEIAGRIDDPESPDALKGLFEGEKLGKVFAERFDHVS